jgi:hypothetical protein
MNSSFDNRLILLNLLEGLYQIAMKKFLFVCLSSIPFLCFSQTITSTGQLNVPRWEHEAQLLYNGKVLAFGGDNGDAINTIVYKSAELYDPISETWTYTGNMNKVRTSFASIILNNGDILAIGGNDGTIVNPTASCEIYSLSTGTWSYTDSLAYPSAYHTAIRLMNGNVLAVAQAGCQIYDMATNTWEPANNPQYGGEFVLTMLNDGRILATGADAGSGPRKAVIYDPVLGVWTTVPNDMNGIRFHHSATLLPNGKVLIYGSTNSTDNITAEIFDPATNTFTPANNMLDLRANSPGILMDNGKVLSFGIGDFFSPSNTKCIQIFNPANGTWTTNSYTTTGTQAYTIHKLHNGKILVTGGSYTTGNGASRGCALIDQGISPCTLPDFSTITSSGAPTCYGSDGLVTISNSEAGVVYELSMGGIKTGSAVNGGGSITLNASASHLVEGSNVINIIAKKSGCPSFILNDTSIIQCSQALVSPSISITGFDTFCFGDSVKLSAPLGYASYLWSNNKTTTEITEKQSGSFSLQVKTAAGCSSYFSAPVTVTVHHPQVLIQTTSGSDTIADGDEITFDAILTDGGPNPFYQWKVNGINIGIDSSVFTASSLNDNDLIRCDVTLNNAFCNNTISISSNAITVTVDYSPQVLLTRPLPNTSNFGFAQQAGFILSHSIDVSTLNFSTVKLSGSNSGHLSVSGKSSFELTGTKDVTLTNFNDFHAGEKISVCITKNLKSTNGGSLSKPYLFDFFVKPSVSTGNFIQQPDVTVGGNTSPLCIADYNGDGNIDILSCNSWPDNNIVIKFNNGNGVYTASKTSSLTDSPSQPCSFDFDNDGDLDLALCNYYPKKVLILLNDGNGSFTLKQSIAFTSNPTLLNGCDIEGDGDIDLIIVSPGIIDVFKNNGSATFALGQTFNFSSISGDNEEPAAIAIADFDSDKDMDIAISGRTTNKVFIELNNGIGSFTLFGSLQVGVGPWGMIANDLDNDGDVDFATSNHYSNNISVGFNNGSAVFTVINTNTSFSATALCSGDFDGDGDLDLGITRDNSGIGCLWMANNGNGGFYFGSYIGSYTDRALIYMGDLDNDQDIDLITSNNSQNSCSIFFNGGTSAIISAPVLPGSVFCSNRSLNINNKIKGVFNANNAFTVQLSDSSGNFSTPINIGISSGANDTIIQVTLPGVIYGDHYKIRVNSSNPALTGKSSTAFFIKNLSVPDPVSIVGDDTVCAGLHSYSVTKTTDVNYVWSVNSNAGILSTSDNTATMEWNWKGTFPLICTPYNVCGSGISDSLVVRVNDIPLPPSFIDNTFGQCRDSLKTYYTSTLPDVTYSWIVPAGWSGSSNTNNITVLASHTASFAYLTAIVTNGCGSNSSVYDLDPYNCGSTSLNLHPGRGFVEIYPNPTQGLVNIIMESPSIITVIVENPLGSSLLTNTVSPQGGTIDLSGIGKGIYFIRINTGGQQIVQKIIVD